MDSNTPSHNEDELVPCGGPNNELGGCCHVYELGTVSRTGGLCPRCKKYKQATTEMEQTRVQSLPWCRSCGVCGPLIDDPCGRCARELQGVDLIKASAAANRADVLGRRVHANRPSRSQQTPEATSRSASGSSTNSHIGPSTPAEDLLALRGVESTIAIQWSIRLSNATNGTIEKDNGAMGKTMRSLPESTSSQHLAEYMIKESQIVWKGANNMWPLRPEYCDVRGHKNATFPEHGHQQKRKNI